MEIIVLKILSICYLSIGLGIIFNKNFYTNGLKSFLNNFPAMFVAGFIALIAGVLIVENVNAIESKSILVKVIGYIAIVKGISILMLPKLMKKYEKLFSESFILYVGFFAILLALGMFYLLYNN